MSINPVSRTRVTAAVFVCAMLALAAAVGLPLIGSAPIEYARAFAGESPHREILFEVRLARVLLAMLTGGALALGGVVFQALLRDALATPYTLGVSSGASLGAVAAISFGLSTTLPAALVGAAATLALVLSIASEDRRISSFTLLMAGVTINSICLALILFCQSFAGVTRAFSITRWLMGGIDPAPYSTLAVLGVTVFAGAFITCARARAWNLLAVGEEWASTRGVAVKPLILTGYFTGSILTGAVTALTGPIGFVGLIVPHALRMVVGADHRLLLPCSFFLGATFLALCDTIARVAIAPAEIPVGVITALTGGPFFIYLLRRKTQPHV